MNLTQFRFFKNTPLIDFQNTIHFNSNAERDLFFLEGGHYSELTQVIEQDFNFVRDRSTLTIDVPYNSMRGVNYCTFLSEMEPTTRYYAYVVKYEYLNDQCVKVYLLIDGIMTYTQGNMLQQLPNLNIERQHLSPTNYNNSLWTLKNNNDILKTHTKNYFHTDELLFDDLIVLMKASVDLEGDFGTIDDPKMKTSSGINFDKITSPLNLYACDRQNFNGVMKRLADFPWIAQNITSLVLLPKIFLNTNLQPMVFGSGDSLSGLTSLSKVSGAFTHKTELVTALAEKSYTMEETYALFGLDPVQDKHLLRNEYTTTEVYNYAGGQLFIDNGQLHKTNGLEYKVDIITGYHNELKLYVDNYRTDLSGIRQGSYVNDSLTINQFDDIPMLINNFDLAMAKSANVRANTESKLLSNRFESITAPDTKVKDRFMNAAQMLSGFSVTDLFGKFKEEYDFVNQQKAEFADMALETPSISSQTNGNSFNIANDVFGIHFKYSKPTLMEMIRIKKYYKLFGFEVNDQSGMLDMVNSMTLCNYVKFSGSWSIPNADVALVEMMKAQFENGVRLWHNTGSANPMTRDPLLNEMVVV